MQRWDKPGVALNAPITGGGIVKLAFNGNLVVYNLQLAGQATFYDRVFPPASHRSARPVAPW